MFVAKFGISSAFNLIYVCYMQLVPTVFAATVFGAGNTVSRVVTIVAPVVAKIEGVFPLILTLIISIMAAISSFFMVTKQPRYV